MIDQFVNQPESGLVMIENGVDATAVDRLELGVGTGGQHLVVARISTIQTPSTGPGKGR